MPEFVFVRHPGQPEMQIVALGFAADPERVDDPNGTRHFHGRGWKLMPFKEAAALWNVQVDALRAEQDAATNQPTGEASA